MYLVLDPRVGAARHGGPCFTPLHLPILVQGAQGLRALLSFLLSGLGGFFSFCHLLGKHCGAPYNAETPKVSFW